MSSTARKAAALAAAMLLLGGCNCHSVTSGVVVSKQYEPGYTYIQMICASYNSSGACTVYVPLVQTVPDSWELCLRDDSQDKPISQQDTGCVEVTQKDFASHKIGDHYP